MLSNNIYGKNNTGNQAVSLRSFPLFRSAVPVGRRQKSLLPPFHRHFTALKKKQQLENKQLFFLRCFVPHLHTFSTLRSAGLMHPQYRFIPFRSVNYATLHSSSIMSAALYFFSGCSFAQPSGFAPLSLCT